MAVWTLREFAEKHFLFPFVYLVVDLFQMLVELTVLKKASRFPRRMMSEIIQQALIVVVFFRALCT